MTAPEARSLEVEPFKTLVIGVTGRPRVGSTTFARHISGVLPHDLDPRLGEYGGIQPINMRWLLKQHGYKPPEGMDPEDPAGMHDFHYSERVAGRGSDIFKPLDNLQGNIIVVEKIRHEWDARHFLRRGGYLLHLAASQETCDARDTHGPEALAKAKLELTHENDNPYTSNILGCIDMAQVTVDFEGTIDASLQLGLSAIRNIGLHKLGYEKLLASWPQTPEDIAS